VNTKGDPFADLNNLRLTPEEAAAAMNQAAAARRGKGQAKRLGQRAQFVMLPVNWVEQLNNSRVAAAWPIAVYVLHQHWKTSGKPVRVSNELAKTIGVTRRTKWRALRELERLGLIQVDVGPRRSPRVRVRQS
jgi:hypothetical protein